MSNPLVENHRLICRRAFLGHSASGLGLAALGSLLSMDRAHAAANKSDALPGLPHFPPKAKRVLCLFQAEGFSHVDLFDFKQTVVDHHASFPRPIPSDNRGDESLRFESCPSLAEFTKK